ncbi:MAG: hypothetical protein GX593_12225 [Actinomycetales bacterium]|nr:hypothetical protein [Actinomycetales bacterium]
MEQVLVPPSYDIAFSVVALLGLALFVLAIVRWWRLDLSGTFVGLLWFLVILLVPVLGPLVFLATLRLAPSLGEGRSAQA